MMIYIQVIPMSNRMQPNLLHVALPKREDPLLALIHFCKNSCQSFEMLMNNTRI